MIKILMMSLLAFVFVGHAYAADKAKKFYDNGQVMSETFLKDGKEVLREFYRSGKVRREIPYVNGLADGIAKDYYESGKVESITEHVNGKTLRTVIYWENGNMASETFYDKDHRVVKKKLYDENGKLESEK